MRQRMRALNSDDPVQQRFAIDAMFNDGHIMRNEDDGGIYSRYRLTKSQNQRLVDAVRNYDAAAIAGMPDVGPPKEGLRQEGQGPPPEVMQFLQMMQQGKGQ